MVSHWFPSGITTLGIRFYVPNSKGGPTADTERFGEWAVWFADGDLVRSAASPHPEDDDWGQAGTLVRDVRDVLDDSARQRLVSNIVGHLLNGASEPVLLRAFESWRKVDNDLGDKVESGVCAG